MTGDPEAVTRRAVEAFGEAFARRDVAAVMAAMTPDCTFEDTTPPAGRCHAGDDEVRAAWEELFATSPEATFRTEDLFVAGDRAVACWTYRWGQDEDGTAGHVRGVDLFRVRDGRVAEKRSYVKG